MTNYVFAYHGGTGAAETPEAQEQVMAEWGAWFGTLGPALSDGGSPFDAAATVHPDGSTTDGGSTGLGGYSIVSAPSLAAATDLAKGCPVLRTGGSVDVYETVAM
jgi:hypothetical protein